MIQIPRVTPTTGNIIESVWPAEAAPMPAAAPCGEGEIPVVELRGMPIHAITREQCVEHVLTSVASGHGGWIVTPNLDILRRFATSPAFRALVASATLNVADGMPLVWASRVKGQPVPERVNGTDLMYHMAEAAAQHGSSVYFLGGSTGTAESAARKFREKHPGLDVAGCYCPPFGFERDMAGLAVIEEKLVAAQPDIIFVGLGSPKQDVLINALRLRLPRTWWVGVGVSFSFASGDLARAPSWAQRAGLEWAYRLRAEPRRLAKRYLLTGIPFFVTTMLVSMMQRFFPGTKQTAFSPNIEPRSGASN